MALLRAPEPIRFSPRYSDPLAPLRQTERRTSQPATDAPTGWWRWPRSRRPDEVEALDEAQMLEEEFTVVNRKRPDAKYRKKIRELDEGYEAYIASLKAGRDEIPPELVEAAATFARERAGAKRKAFRQLVHRTRSNRTALCLSGGGIRSATFSLGVIQALAARGFLKEFQYLSTVSGGGYIGSWLLAWIHRHRRGMAGVEEALHVGEPDAIFRLREFSRYLAPRFGFLTSDTWTLVATYLRNLLVTWFALVPTLAALLAVPRLLVSLINANADVNLDRALRLIPFLPTWDVALLLIIYASVTLLVLALTSLSLSVPGASVRGRWRLDTEKDFVSYCLLGIAISGLALATTWGFLATHQATGMSRGVLRDWAWWFETRTVYYWIVGGVALHSGGWAIALAFQIPQLILEIPHLFRRFGQALVHYWQFLIGQPIRPRLRAAAFVVEERVSGIPHHVFRAIQDVPGTVRAAGTQGAKALSTAYSGVTDAWPTVGRTVFAIVIGGGLGGFLMWLIVVSHAVPQVDQFNTEYVPMFVTFSPPAMWLVMLFTGTVFVAAISPWSSDHEREWYARAGAWLTILITGWIALCAITFAGPIVLERLNTEGLSRVSALGVVSGFVAAFLGRPSAKTRRPDEPESWLSVALTHIASVAAPVLLVLVLALIASGTSILLEQVLIPGTGWPISLGATHFNVLDNSPISVVLLLLAALMLIFTVINRWVDLGVFSMHAMYRDRLIRAYMAASRRHRHPNAFTGFDSDDNLPLVQLQPGLFCHADGPTLKRVLGELVSSSPPTSSFQPDRDDGDTVRALVVRLLTADGLDRLRSIVASNTLSTQQEEFLIRRWNAVLIHPELSSLASNGDMRGTDPVLANKRFLSQQEWFGEGAVNSRPVRLFPVVNTALNLTHGSHLAMDRRAEPFAMTPLHAGATTLGFVPMYWHDKDREKPVVRYYAGITGVTLGTAMTISGAAANPAMGFHSSPIVSFLLALFNVRLGMWISSPSTRQSAASRRSRSVWLLFREALGISGMGRGFVNLSDGGHFENLGLYEMVRRRCHLILAVDAGADPNYDFDDLGNAISKARIDFGIPIEFINELPIHGRTQAHESTGQSAHGAVARIRYSAVDRGTEDGWLLYVKPALDGNEPVDVRAYAEQNRHFPHQPTTNQFFSEVQFEAYRVLGSYSIDKILGTDSTLEQICERFQAHHERLLAGQARHIKEKGAEATSAGPRPKSE